MYIKNVLVVDRHGEQICLQPVSGPIPIEEASKEMTMVPRAKLEIKISAEIKNQ